MWLIFDMLIADQISVDLGSSRILHEVGLTAQPGQVSAIVGANGSGKTTLLRCITGELDHRGRIRLNGKDISGLKAWELAEMRAVLPQASALAFPFTAVEVVNIGLHRGLSGDRPELPFLALERVGLAHYADRFFQELSGGEQQRVQLARVLAQVWDPVPSGVPRWLFLDEPVSALDIGHQLQVMELVRDFARQGGGVLAVMHDLNLTAMFADQMTILSKGQVLASGTPQTVMTDDILSRAYDCSVRIGQAPPPGMPFILPQAANQTPV